MIKINNDEIKLIVCDVDGTLRTTRKPYLSEKTIKELNKFIDDGCYFVLNTGNMPNHMEEFVKSVNPKLNDKTKWFIGNSGSVIHDFETKKSITTGVFDNKMVNTMVNVFKRNNVFWSFLDSDLSKIYFGSQENLDEFANLSNSKFKKNFAVANAEVLDNITSPKVIFKTNDDDKFDKVISELKEVIDEDLFQVMCWTKNSADIVIPHLNKFTGLLKMIEEINKVDGTNLTLDNVIFFGDSWNDIDVFENHKYSIAMGNAIDELKEIAFAITDDVEDDGVVNFLNKYWK
ncbi:HAD-IIB family hydrolase [Mesoplasma photuris]|uniref:HAD-IIB family hydrolase n=1 Tax=Mesoplasma photuris TaxID=217731 RepID=UPI0004E12733|nr:HAD family hydrolase [Mesoplasma photuris]